MWAHALILCMWLSICIWELEKHLTKTPWFIAIHVTPGTAIYWKFWHENSRMVNVRNLKFFFSFLLNKSNSWRMCLCKNGFIICSNILICYLKDYLCLLEHYHLDCYWPTIQEPLIAFVYVCVYLKYSHSPYPLPSNYVVSEASVTLSKSVYDHYAHCFQYSIIQWL